MIEVDREDVEVDEMSKYLTEDLKTEIAHGIEVSRLAGMLAKELKLDPEMEQQYLAYPEVKLLRNLSGNRALLSVTIHEGRNRQVRRMCDLADMHVTRLIRVSEGDVKLGNLKSGAWRYLSAQEVAQLKK